jgi:integrase
VLRLAYYTGLRHQELLHLDWVDINFSNLLVRVRAKPEEDFLPKSHCERDVPIPGWLAAYLADYRQKLKHNGDQDPVLQPTRRNGRRPDRHPLRWYEICHQVRDTFIAAGLAGPGRPVGLHTFRHSYCTNLVRAGADVEQLRALAGHSSIVVSQRYLWSDSESRRVAAEAMFAMLDD